MNPIRSFDEAILAAADGLVMWLWNRFEVRRIWSIRVAALTVILGNGFQGSLVAAVVWAFSLFTEELLARLLSPKMRQVIVMTYRGALPWSFLRPAIMAAGLFYAVVGAAAGSLAEVIVFASGTAYIALSWSIVPTDPPKRRESMLAPVLASVRT